MKQISILGCGWLGLPLAKALLSRSFEIKGSTTSENKLAVLKNSGIQPYLIALEADNIQGNVSGFLENSEILIIDIPPKLRGNEKENFVDKIAILIPFIEVSSVKKVLFISSTSVYRDANSIVSTVTKPQPDTESGKQLLEVETLLQSNKNFRTTVVRFGGLIGEDRHPVTFLAGRNNLENPDGPINLIHQKDCIGILLRIIEKECWNETFNAVAPFHPTREAYYTQKATELHLALPKFNPDKPSLGKTILSEKVEKVLDYTFIVPNL